MHVIHHVIQEDSMKPSNPSRVLTLERGLQILEYIVERRNVTVTNVATAFGIQKSASHRFLNTLKYMGYVEQTPQSDYALTGRLRYLAEGVVPRGDPLQSFYGDAMQSMTTTELDAARERLGLNGPIWMQYAKWIGNVMQGDFGISLKYKRPVLDVVSPLIGNTLMLGGIAYALVFMLAIALALFCAPAGCGASAGICTTPSKPKFPAPKSSTAASASTPPC